MSRELLDYLRLHSGRVKMNVVDDRHVEVDVSPDERACDFCMAVSATYVFDAESKMVKSLIPGVDVVHQFIGGWSACTTCKRLIDAGDVNAVASHATSTIAKHYRVPVAEIMPGVRRAHRVFWKNRKLHRAPKAAR
jgi:hypothetical protein